MKKEIEMTVKVKNALNLLLEHLKRQVELDEKTQIIIQNSKITIK